MYTTVSNALKDIKKGKLLILVDDRRRENEGDFFMAAQFATPQKVNTMISLGKGLLVSPLAPKRAATLELSLMVPLHKNEENNKCNFTLSVDARYGISTGISAFDRAKTLRVLADKKSAPRHLVSPGHIFPVIAQGNGLLARQGHTEAAITLLHMARLSPAGALCEILRPDGAMARRNDLLVLAKKRKIKILLTEKLQRYARSQPSKEILSLSSQGKVMLKASANLPTRFGLFRIAVFHSLPDRLEHVALWMGNIKGKKNVLVRVHSQCLTGDTFISVRCDCRQQLESSLEKISQKKQGLFIYLNQEGRGIGLTNKIRAYALQDKGMDTAQANQALGFKIDERDMWVAAGILEHFKIRKIQLLTNNPEKIHALKRYGISDIQRIPLAVTITPWNKNYLETKKKKMGHLID